MSERYDPGPAEHPAVTSAALDAAQDAAGFEGDGAGAVLAFLKYMSQNYVGDYYVEGSLAHLATMVRELT